VWAMHGVTAKEKNVKTARVTAKKAADFDKMIVANLLLDQAEVDEVKKEKMVIGIKNEAGEIYRYIGAANLNSYMNAVEELFDLELADELQNVEGTRNGCDAIFYGL
jgi:hypothetical protein